MIANVLYGQMKLVFIAAAMSIAVPASAQQSTEGEVRKVDRKAKTVTLKHGPIQSLDMPAMTMVFQVKDAAMLEKVKAGDKVLFDAQKRDGVFTVMKIEIQK